MADKQITVEWCSDRAVVRGLEGSDSLELVGIDERLRAVEICAQPGEGSDLSLEKSYRWVVYGLPARDNSGRRSPLIVTLPTRGNALTLYVLDIDGRRLDPALLGAPEFRAVCR